MHIVTTAFCLEFLSIYIKREAFYFVFLEQSDDISVNFSYFGNVLNYYLSIDGNICVSVVLG